MNAEQDNQTFNETNAAAAAKMTLGAVSATEPMKVKVEKENDGYENVDLSPSSGCPFAKRPRLDLEYNPFADDVDMSDIENDNEIDGDPGDDTGNEDEPNDPALINKLKEFQVLDEVEGDDDDEGELNLF